ncbi:hypothetical protein CTAYLR_006299 [Chrysophaeum taylorii]|uniref:Uncharacterized protein n=1 Tax=Chrysophaeum taylorii TaxID=2483200 RepID=A0AAD7XNM7_9STRA|nr:hypothetical protein CTAYLR_006299 [Chrysophaeum taylorii]
MDISIDDPTLNLSKLEIKYMRELRRTPMRGELMKESINDLKSVLQNRGWARSEIVGIEKDELVLRVLPYLDPNNLYIDDEPYPLASNCVTQFVLRALLLGFVLFFAQSTLGASNTLNAALFTVEILILVVRNVRIRRRKRDKMRKLL